MGILLRWYAGWLFQGIGGIDRLVLWPPISEPDDPAAFARELYHRYLAHLLAMRLWRYEWLALLAAAILLLLLKSIIGLAGPGIGILFALIGIGLMVTIGVKAALRFLLAPVKIQPDIDAARALVRRLCLREVPEGTPPDLADPWRHNWMTADGRPLAAEIGEFDLRSTELVGRCKPIFFAALALGLVPVGFSVLGGVALLVILVISICKALSDPAPIAIRSRLLDVAAAGTAEGAAWAMAGASRWAARTEEARKSQLAVAIADKSPVLTLGRATGLLAARGDGFAPSAGLEMALSLTDLMQHLLVLGGTGSGKTAGVLRPLCKQLGVADGIGLVVLDGKGALPGEVAKFIPDFTVIDPATRSMSLVEGLTPTEVVTVISDRLGRSEGKDKFFEESAAGLMRHAAVMVKARDEASWSLEKIWRMANNGPGEQLLEDVDLTVPQVSEAVSFFKDEWPGLDKEVKSSIMATLRAWYTTITGHPDTLKWAMTLAGKSDVDLTGALRGKRIGILAPAHRYGEAGPVVMALLKARIFAAIRDRADKGMAEGETPVVLVMDEAQEVTTRQDALILGIARSLSLAIVASTQTVEGIEARLGSAEAAQFLTLFGSVIALQNRSARTTQVVTARLGASFRPTLDAVPGVPTVRDAVTAQRASGRIAAAKTQPAVAATIGFGEGRRAGDLLRAISPFQLFRGALQGQQERPQSRVQAAPLVLPDELTELVVEPDTALAILTRARVPRRDVVKLSPVY
jgi:hypothetical protein